ncbi:hypothetical protein NIES4074_28680 [Cylindrospermum sp. NIES-4074]|nr:hypothetical protein NIES4074_28680 [Cylindrospermum sp. NIES-4074]
MLISAGSSSNVPKFPLGALRLTLPEKFSSCLPDTSTNPPFPELTPPVALIFPLKAVNLSAQTITLPPLPLSRESALITESLLTNVRKALGTLPLP